MIYTLISDLNYSFKSDENADNDFSIDKVNSSAKCKANEITVIKRDCRILRQPLSLLSPKIEKIIDNTKNHLSRAERRLAYTTLLCGVKIFFGIDNYDIAKTPDGKPYLITRAASSIGKTTLENYCSNSSADFSADLSSKDTEEKYQKNEDLQTKEDQHQKNTDFSYETNLKSIADEDNPKIYISISHSDGVVAVCISDEGEVGVDIQSEITPDKAERLNTRFLGNINTSSDKLKVAYYYCNLSEDEAILTAITLPNWDQEEFTSKWAYAESILKLYGRGFGDLNRLGKLSDCTRSEIKKYQGVNKFAICISVQK